MKQHLLLVSILTILVDASSRWGASSRGSGHAFKDTNSRIDLRNNNKNEESDLGSKETDFVKFLQEGRERRRLGHDLGFGDSRGRRGSKKSSEYSGDNIFDHEHDGKSSSSHYSYSSYKSSKKSGKGGGKGGEWGSYDSNDGNGGTTTPPTPQPTVTATTLAPTVPPPSTASPTLPLIERSPAPTQENQKEIPTLAPVGRPTSSPRTPSPTATEAPNRNCVVNRDGLFGAQIGVAEVIPFAYELIVFGTPTTEQQISMISTIEEGISNAIIPELFDACTGTSASGSSSENREVPQEEEETNSEESPERHHFHTGSGMFPEMTTSTTNTAQAEERRHQSHSGGGGSFTTAASLEWDSERRHNHNRDGGRHLQQTRLTGLSSRPKDEVVDAECSGPSLGFECFPVSGQLTVYSQSRLGQFALEAIKDSIQRAVSTGNLQNLDNRILGVNHRDLDTDPFPESIDDTPSPTLSPTNEPFRPGPTGTESDPLLPLWAIITIAAAGFLLLVVLAIIWCLRRRSNRQYANNLSNRPASSNIGEIKKPITNSPGPNYRPPPSNLNNNAFGRPGRPNPANSLDSSLRRPQGSPSNDSFGPPNPHPSTREFGPPNPHPSPIRPPASLGTGGARQGQVGGRQKRPGSTRNNSGTVGSASSTPTNTKPPSQGSFGESSKDPTASAARKAAYGLGPIKSPVSNKNAFQLPTSCRPDALSVFSGVNSVSGDNRKNISGSQSVGGGDPNRPSTKARPISSANSVSGYSAAGGSRVEIEMPTSEDESGLSSESGESGEESGSDESEENVTLSSSERRNAANKFGDPDNAFGDADNAFGIGMTPTEVERYSSSSSYEEEVDEEYEIEYVEDDEEEGDEVFLSSSADEEFWDDEVVEEVVDDPDQPILANFTSSS